MGRAPALLVLAALLAWTEYAPRLGPLAQWPSVLIVALVLMPALFSLSWAALPLWDDRRLPALTVAAVALAVGLSLAGAGLFANFAKFAAVTLAGWFFLGLFEELSWIVAVALLIPWVDAYSVWRGPTRAITTHHAAIFTTLSVAFVVPGGGAARLGLPDIMFFAVFLAASVRFGLRPRATWAAMTASLGLTMVLTTVWATNGLPALPGISLGFLVANGDLVWRSLSRRPQRSLGASPD